MALENELALEGFEFKEEGFGKMSASYRKSDSIEQEQKVIGMLKNYSNKVEYYVNLNSELKVRIHKFG